MTITKIVNYFRAAANYTNDDEVVLFRKLALSIVNWTNAVFVEETHGASKCNVFFDSSKKDDDRCEISDLLIISRSMDSLRATFWQAKKLEKSNWLACSNSKSNHLDFMGTFNQWELLSLRPEVTGVPPFNPTRDLLSSFSSPAIGSFGVFYERASKIEIMHSTAEFIVCPNQVKHPRLVINAHLEKYVHNHSEAIVKSDLKSFLTALFSHQIGALLMPNEKAHQWLVRYANSKVAASGQQLPTNFFSGFGDLNRGLSDSPDNPTSDRMKVLLVDAEPTINAVEN